ncbi:Zn-ribbon domain-containing OB-fold protein [Actinoplanes sp. ATCC 53533]|uniref:Zn-ribbon domain-containing OB-fold protein n=1 Tax=Actinoplanes sp. ATCC 53533 TaxID=1288362 RepID=UPI0018F38A22|nr:OB-fold domain-containing protein [Actinoplanes sp. ATCC 53533]
MSLAAPYTIEFPFQRTVGPKIGTFLAGLREARLFGVRTPRGVLCPPLEFDPVTGAETDELVELTPAGVVTAWTWVPARPGDPVPHDFAWALIAVDGTVGALFHAVDVGGDLARMRTGLRVRARWRPERVGDLRDLQCFEAAP